MSNNGIGHTLNVIRVDFFGFERCLPGTLVANRPFLSTVRTRLGREVRACIAQNQHKSAVSGDNLPVRDRLWLGRSFRGVTTGIPILPISTLCIGPPDCP